MQTGLCQVFSFFKNTFVLHILARSLKDMDLSSLLFSAKWDPAVWDPIRTFQETVLHRFGPTGPEAL